MSFDEPLFVYLRQQFVNALMKKKNTKKTRNELEEKEQHLEKGKQLTKEKHL